MVSLPTKRKRQSKDPRLGKRTLFLKKEPETLISSHRTTVTYFVPIRVHTPAPRASIPHRSHTSPFPKAHTRPAPSKERKERVSLWSLW